MSNSSTGCDYPMLFASGFIRFFSQVTAWSLFGNQRRKVKWLCLPHLIMVGDPVEGFQCQRFTLHHTQAHVHRVDPKKGYRYSHGPVKEPVDLKNIHFIYQSFRTTTVVGVMFICWLSTGDRGPCFSRIWLWSQPFFHANLSICSGTLSAVWWDNCPAHPANFAVNTMRASRLQVSSRLQQVLFVGAGSKTTARAKRNEAFPDHHQNWRTGHSCMT